MRGLPHLAQHLLIGGALAAVAALTYLPAFGFPPVITPFDIDNVWALHLAEQPDPAAFFTAPPTAPLYRPLAYLSLWVQDELHGLRPSFFFTVNIALWIACVLLAYGLIVRHTASAVAGGAGALAMLVDGRALSAVIWIFERQNTLACLFGATALLVAYRLPPAGRNRALGVGAVTALLLSAALSKEYGLAFSAAIAVTALVTRPDQRRVLLFAVGLSIAAYSALRWGLATGSSSPRPGVFCDDVGFLWAYREACYGELDLGVLQYGWNIGATLIATLLPTIFTVNGVLLVPGSLVENPVPGERFTIIGFLFPAAVAACAVVAWIRHPRTTLPLLTLVVANALLSFALFRPRNQLVGVFGLYVSAGIGFVPALQMLEARTSMLVRRVRSASGHGAIFARVPASALGLAAVGLAFAAGTLSRSADVRTDIENEAARYATNDPCDLIGEFVPQMDGELPKSLRRMFNVQPADCLERDLPQAPGGRRRPMTDTGVHRVASTVQTRANTSPK